MLALICIIIAPGFGRSQQLFQPVVFSQLFWVLSFYQLVKWVNFPVKKHLWYLTAFVILGISVKYDMLFFVFGLSALLLIKKTRLALLQLPIWQNAVVAMLLLLPNLLWQFYNDFPAINMFSRLYEMQLNNLSRSETLSRLVIEINPVVSLIMIIPAFIYLIKHSNAVNLPLSLSIVLSVAILFISNGKPYYFYPIILTILPFGAIFWERLKIPKRKLVVFSITFLLLLGSVLIPFGMPVYSFNHYKKSIYKYEKKHVEGGKFEVKFEEYYSNRKWIVTMQQLKLVYNSLPESDKEPLMIWGKHYGQAGAINLFSEEYNLPAAFSYHGSFYSWAPKGEMPKTTIALSYRVGNFFEPYFKDVKLVKTIYNPYADKEEELYQRIYVCKEPKQSFDELKVLFKKRIFE